MTRLLLAVVAGLLLAWCWTEWVAERDARALDRAVRQAEEMSAHPSRPRGPEDDPDWPGVGV